MDQLIQNVCPSAGGISAGMVTQVIGAILSLFCSLSDPRQWPNDISPTIIKEGPLDYDFIVVGSGSAGSVLANRLSEVDNWNVLLIEAGGTPPADSEIPSLLFEIQRTQYDWGYQTVKDPNYCLSMTDQTCKWPMGKLLGGTSAINAMMYVRGNKEDYNEWAEMGNYGWNWESVLKMFRKAEKIHDKKIELDENAIKYHGLDGFLNVSPYFEDDAALRDTIMSAWEELGYNRSKDINGENQIGIGSVHGTLYKGRRCSSAKAYLAPIKDRKNLHVLYNAQVTKVLIDEKTKQATGVKVIINNKEVMIKATKEVILSAGVIKSPQILMLSGIGPQDHLKSLGIIPIVNLPVGENLQDHIYLTMNFAVNVGNEKEVVPQELFPHLLNYIITNEGPVGGIRITDLTGFINSLQKNNPVPDIQYVHVHYMLKDKQLLPGVTKSTGFNEEMVNKLKELNKKHEILTIGVVLLKPKSSGRIIMKSSNPLDNPLIYPNYLKHKEDMKTIINGIRFIEKLEETNTFKNAKMKLLEWSPESCASFQFKSDEYWECLTKNVGATLYHPVGTAKMGLASDKTSVVDHHLRVHGIKGLRIIDASIMPNIIRGNTNAPTIMIGEQGASFIKEEWLKPDHDRNEL